MDLKNLQKKLEEGHLFVCQTDKSGRFALLTRQQYLDAGKKHTDKDKEIDIQENEEVERTLNGHLNGGKKFPTWASTGSRRTGIKGTFLTMDWRCAR